MNDVWWEKQSLVPFEAPTSIFIVGVSGSGKSYLTRQILQHSNGMFKKPTVRILFCYGVWQNLYDQMNKEIPFIEFHQGLPSSDELYEWGAIEGHKILVLDDLMIDAADKMEMVHLFCVGSHHYNITVIHLLQNIFHKGKAMRTASLNCHYFILFPSYRDRLQIQSFGKQLFPGKSKYFMDAFEKATSKPYGYLLVDISPHSDKTYQLRTDILPGQVTRVFHPK
jgi:tRNA A37 threonylcarbamoyladenosine biosynthesis protein TsaE